MDTSEAHSSTAPAVPQLDVEHLLAQVEGGSVETGKQKQAETQRYDFRQPSFLSTSELRKLRIRSEEFIRSLAARLSIYLRLEFGLQMTKLETISFQKFIEGLSNPTHLTLFKVDPLRGVCLLDIPPRLGLSIVDRQLGGSALCTEAARDLSEIEVGLLDQAVQIILSEWCNLWSGLLEVRPVLLGHESNGRFLQTSPHDTVMLILAMQAQVGELAESIQIGFPYYTLEPLILKLNTSLKTTENSNALASTAPLKWNPALEEIKIPVTAEWSQLEMSANQLAQLTPGDILPLTSQMAAQVQVRLANIPKFLGNLGTRGHRWAVEITHLLKS
jgi:flagellar motor switch protein FliM